MKCGFRLFVLLFTLGFKGDEAGVAERRLHSDLLLNPAYNPMARPVQNESHSVEVKLGLQLQQIIDVDEKNENIMTNIWLEFDWTDEHLKWDPQDYGNVEQIRLLPKQIWTPDILLYNSVDENFNTVYQANVIVSYTGAIYWLPPAIVKSTCKINIAWWPFDEQKCKLKFGSWTYSKRFLDLHDGRIVDSDYVQNGEWHLVDVLKKVNSRVYECCPDDPYLDVTFTIWIRRRTLYYGFNLIIPCLLIALMALLDFILPPEAGEKLTLGITIFMSLCVFLLMVAESMPPTSDAVPLIGVYFSTIMIIVSASQVFTVLVLNFNYRDPDMHTMPPAIRKIFLHWLPFLLMMKRPSYLEDNYSKLSKRDSETGGSGEPAVPSSLDAPPTSKSLLANVLNVNDDTLQRVKWFNQAFQHDDASATADTPRRSAHAPQDSAMLAMLENISNVEFLLNSIRTELTVITDKMRDEAEEEELKRDWKFAAIVLDRLCLLLFTLVFTVATSAIILAAPHLVV